MTDPVYDIFTSIDETLAKKFTGKYYGLCEMVNAQGERYPVTARSVKRERINPADTWQLQIYHRLVNGVRVPEDEFGRNEVWSYLARMVIITNPNLGETIPIRIIKELPRQVVVIGGSAVITDAMNMVTNHEEIASTEFSAIPEDKHRLTKNLFIIEYSLRLQLCTPIPIPPITGNGIELEESFFLVELEDSSDIIIRE